MRVIGPGMVWRGNGIDNHPEGSWYKLLHWSAIRWWMEQSFSSGWCVGLSGFNRFSKTVRGDIAFLLFPFVISQQEHGGLVQRRLVSLSDEGLRRARSIHVSGPCGQSVADLATWKSEFSPGPRRCSHEVLL